jgi:RHS repeat-associated protein
MNVSYRLFPKILSNSDLWGIEEVFLSQRAQRFARSAQGGYALEWSSSMSEATNAVWAAMPAGDADVTVRWDSCRLDFLFLFGQAKRKEENNLNGRLYDPVTGRMFSPDKFVANGGFTQDFNRYSYARNNPLMYTDLSGHKLKGWQWAMIALGIDALSGGFFSASAILTAGAATTATSTVGATLAATAVTVAGATYGPTVLTSPIVAIVGACGVGGGAKNMVNNLFKINNGLFATDKNKNFFGRVWQFTARFNWEALQTIVGNLYTQGRNIGGRVDRVDYFGGATFATKENSNKWDGVTLGNYININIPDEITGNFKDRVLSDPLYMHEFGHTFDSQLFGPSYLFAVGIPSLISASKSELIKKWNGEEVNNPLWLYTHDVFWTETRANKRAAQYFKKYYGMDWETLFPDYPLNNPFK